MNSNLVSQLGMLSYFPWNEKLCEYQGLNICSIRIRYTEVLMRGGINKFCSNNKRDQFESLL